MVKKTDKFLHYREGKTQEQRFLDKLNPANLQLNDLDVADWILFAFNFAKHVNYFDKENPENLSLNWQDFFDYFEIGSIIKETEGNTDTDALSIPRREDIAYKKLHKSIADKLTFFEKENKLTPHLVLFVAFLKVLEYSKERFNKLTKRHLDFYYSQVLQIEKRAPVEDTAYIIFELAKKAVEEKVAKGTLLDGAKDSNGKKRTYKLSEDLIVNQTKVEQIKSLYIDDSIKEIKVAPVANSRDGMGKALEEDTQFWWPFGYNSTETNYDKLSDGVLGFAVASPLLNLSSGDRTVTINVAYKQTLKKPFIGLSPEQLKSSFRIECSGEKEWLSGTDILQKVTHTSKGLQLTLHFSKDFEAIIAYNDALPGGYATQDPVIRILIEGDFRHMLYKDLSSKSIKSITLNVEVKEIADYILQNDSGAIDITKPFYPFTPQPINGANFTIKSDEVFSKNWETINVKIKWKNTPESIKDHYKAYIANTVAGIRRDYFDNTSISRSVVTDDGYFKANVFLRENETWNLKRSNLGLFEKKSDAYETTFSVSNSLRNIGGADGIRLSLNQSFLQEIYPILYTLTLTGSKGVHPIPGEAYIPLVESIEIDYTAKEEKTIDKANERLGLFLEDVFGHYQETVLEHIVPVHNNAGELYIGLSASPGQEVSLLIQTLEGSENPIKDTFSADEKVIWEVLSGNKWMDLSDYITLNEINNFLQSGIVKFKIPKDIDTANTRLDANLIWVRASMDKAFDAVCKTQGIFAQAVVATFDNNGNDLGHLNDGLPANTIGKLRTRVPKIKSVKQPYNSIGGIYEETDLEYYRRVSERLRHKNRAITQWDYEHLVLEKFPDVFKVKCLNHTSKTSYEAPGYVTLIVVPNTRDRNIFDIYQPRVSQNTLAQITKYVNDLNTMHVEALVINPEYEEIEVDISVKFHQGFDDSFYSKQLDLDIKSFISPWAFKSSAEISFDAAMNRFQMINYIEQLSYIDYIDGLTIKKGGIEDKSVEIQAKPKSILVSSKQHHVKVTNKGCRVK